MGLENQTLDFLKFILVGFSLTFVFDFFRAIRKYSKKAKKYVLIQDLIFFLISIIVTIFVILCLLKSELRPYMFIGVALGASIYLYIISKYVLKVFAYIFKIIDKILQIILKPFKVFIRFLIKIYIFLMNYVKKCCKKFFDVIFNKCINILLTKKIYLFINFKKIKIKNKRGKYEKKERKPK